MAERTLPLKLKEPAYLYEPPSSTGAPIERARIPLRASGRGSPTSRSHRSRSPAGED